MTAASSHAFLSVAAVQHDIAWEEKAANHATVDAALRAAALPRGTLVALPELFDTGFSLDLDAIVDERTTTWASQSAKTHGVHLVAGHARRAADGGGRNCATVVRPDGTEAGTYAKMHPFSFGREAEFYGRGDRLLLVELGGSVICPLICYDLRFPELWRLAALAGAEVFVIGANWPDARQAHWRALCIARAIENQAYVIATNRIGRDPSLRYAGGSLIVDPRGGVIAEADASGALLTAALDLESLRAWRRDFPALRDVHPDLLGSIPIQRVERCGNGG